MAIPKAVAPFNDRVTNHVSRPFAGHVPCFAVVTHVGRRSARACRTPVLCEARIFTDPGRRLVPGPVRAVLRIIGVSDSC